MLTIITGKNSFAIEAYVQTRIAEYIKKYGDLGLTRIDGGETMPTSLVESVASVPFLVAKNMVIIRRLSTGIDPIVTFDAVRAAVSDAVEVIIAETSIDARSVFYKHLKKQAEFQDFKELDQASMVRWIQSFAADKGGHITARDAQYLIDRVGVSQQLLGNDICRLILYDAQITRSSIELLTDATPQSTIFQLLDAAFHGRVKDVVRLYEEQRAMKVEPPQIIALLAWQLHIIGILKVAGDRSVDAISADAKLSRYTLEKSTAVARHLSYSAIREFTRDLALLDVRLKREPIDSDEAVLHYLLALSY